MTTRWISDVPEQMTSATASPEVPLDPGFLAPAGQPAVRAQERPEGT
jgi:hypothetical protein